MKDKHILLICSLLLAFSSCRRIEEPELKGLAYAPIEVDKYIIYDVQNFAHDAFAERTDTTYFQLRETITNSFIDNTGTTVYKIAVEKSTDNGSTWQFERNAVIQKDNTNYQRVEEDLRKVKLSFPFKDRKSWDANEMNTQSSQKAKLTEIDKAYTLSNDLFFPTTVFVDLGNDVDPFFQNIESEVYASGIGLIERTIVDIESQPGKYKEGYEYIQTYKQSNW